MKSLLILLAVNVFLVTAQVPERCFTPPVWHSHISRGVREGSVYTSYNGRFAYDENNLRFRFLEGFADEHEPLFAHYFFYKEHYSLRANFTTRMCERRSLTEPFRPFSIPYDAKYVDTVEIGSNMEPGLGLEVYIWEGMSEDGGYYTNGFTTKGCLPVFDEYMRGQTYYSTHRFYDVEEGYNPDDFVPPEFCSQ